MSEGSPLLRGLEGEVDAQRKRMVLAALFRCEGVVQRTAELLGCSRRTLHRDLVRWGVDKKDWRKFDPDQQDEAPVAWPAGSAATLEELKELRDRAMVAFARSGVRAALVPTAEGGLPAIMAVVEREEDATGLPETVLGFPVVAFTRVGERRLGSAGRAAETLAWWHAGLAEIRARRGNQVTAHAVAAPAGPAR